MRHSYSLHAYLLLLILLCYQSRIIQKMEKAKSVLPQSNHLCLNLRHIPI